VGFRNFLDRLTGSTEELSPAERERRSVRAGCNRLRDCRDRQIVSVRGTVEVLTLRSTGSTPVLEAELDDGTGVLTIVWLGRRHIPGIETGREILVRGRISDTEGVRRIYNPWYQLV
jgi:RecG-like helicase